MESKELKTVSLSSPWSIYYKQLESLFSRDPDIELAFNDKEYVITMRVKGSAKAEALAQLLPATKQFGNVTVQINIVPSNIGDTRLDLFARAFDGNPIVSEIIETHTFGMDAAYVVFEREVVQYFNDDLSDAHGVCSTLYQDIAKEVFGEEAGIFFSTDVTGRTGICCKCSD